MKFSPNHDLEKWRTLWVDAVEHSTVKTRLIRTPEEQIQKMGLFRRNGAFAKG